MTYKTPLAIYIIWHPTFIEGQQIANYLYSVLCRNPEKPLVRSLGIPVYFRYVNEVGKKHPKEINFNESEYTAVIPLVSDEFVIDSDYGGYLDLIHDECNAKKDKRRVYPVALSKHAFNISSKLSSINFIRIAKSEDNCGINTSNIILAQIKSSITHELCRFLMNMKRTSDETDTLVVSPPVKLFISHSKHDNTVQDAIKFRDYINSQTQLKTFFDANDIAYGLDFGEEIKKAAGESALVVFQSDSYAEREWCRIEVLTAKSEGCPIVIVNAIQNGEQRAFPYLGNCPSIRLKEDYQPIIDLTLEQVLSNIHSRLFLDSLTNLYDIKANRILTNVPELYNFIQLKKQKNVDEEYAVVLYPDPPLGTEELDLLSKLDDNFIFITPLSLPSISK